MPVQFDSYDEDDDVFAVEEESNAHAILSFLSVNPEQGFTPAEIHEEIDIPYGSIGPTLKRLHERDLVRHKEPYWAIGTERRLMQYEGMISTIGAIEDRYGPEDPDDWLENAQPVDDG